MFNTSWNAYFGVYGFKNVCEISKDTFEISHTILHISQNMYFTDFILFVIYDILELWRHKPQCDGPCQFCPWSPAISLLHKIPWIFLEFCLSIFWYFPGHKTHYLLYPNCNFVDKWVSEWVSEWVTSEFNGFVDKKKTSEPVIT